MKKFFNLSVVLFSSALFSLQSFSQVCTPLGGACPVGATTNFNAGTSGFSGDFSSVIPAGQNPDGFLRSSENGAGTTKTLLSQTFFAPPVNELINLRFDLDGTTAIITNLTISARTTGGDVVLCSSVTLNATVNCFSLPTPLALAGRQFRFVFTFTVQGGSPANRVVAFDDFGTNVGLSSSPLPVKFARLKATKKGQGIEVCFSNLTEKNVVTYSVQRSTNGQVFTELAAISPLKNNDGEASYCYLDVTPAEGTNIYRVRSTETTGQVSYSPVLKVDGASKGITMVIAPNPATGTALGLQISNLPAGSYQFKIYSATGLLVGQEMLHHNGGSISQSLTLNNLKPGLYNLDLSGSYRLQKQFIVR
ncbi:MAG TPA: T9SS type A sorting domain-containing protein [Flavisolibacter sp.]|nr:T9SS type A sorting domain-containing protein [Flavisolibacter sp.]